MSTQSTFIGTSCPGDSAWIKLYERSANLLGSAGHKQPHTYRRERENAIVERLSSSTAADPLSSRYGSTAIDLRESAIPSAGRGVFAAAGFSYGELIITNPVTRYRSHASSNLRHHDIFPYLFVDPLTYTADRTGCDLLLVFGLISLVNHADTPNSFIQWSSGHLGESATLLAARSIIRGEELTIFYTNVEEYDDISR